MEFGYCTVQEQYRLRSCSIKGCSLKSEYIITVDVVRPTLPFFVKFLTKTPASTVTGDLRCVEQTVVITLFSNLERVV